MRVFIFTLSATLVGVIAAPNTLGAFELTISSECRQTIKGWGFTPGPIDWDGRCLLRNNALLKKLYQESGVTIARFVIGTGTLWRGAGLNEPRADEVILPQVITLRENGLEDYIITILLPPWMLRKYASEEAYVDFDINPLREEREDEYAKYIAAIVSFIRARKMTLPLAISLQNQPDFPQPPYFGGTTVPGCIYTQNQLSRLGAKVRAALDQADLKGVGIIGPETFDRRWLVDALQPVDGADDLPASFGFLSGLAIHSSAEFDELENELSRSFFAVVETARRRGREVWVTDINVAKARNDSEVLLGTFAALRRDLNEMHASYWFWRYGFVWESGGEALVHGRACVEAPVYRALRDLWKAAPLGSQVHTILSNTTDGASRAFCLMQPEQTVLALFNPVERPEPYAIKGIKGNTGLVTFYRGDSSPEVKQIECWGAVLKIEIPPKSVALIVVKL